VLVGRDLEPIVDMVGYLRRLRPTRSPSAVSTVRLNWLRCTNEACRSFGSDDGAKWVERE